VFIFASGNLRLLAATPQILFNGLEVYGLLAIPLFIFLGEIMNEGGITGRLITAARVWLRRVPNELSFVSLFSNLMLASILGSATAQIAVMSRIMVPSMEEAGYPRPYAAAITAAGGLLGPIIPPSMAFIMYGVVSQVSIGRLFIGGIIPGLLLFTFMCVYIALRGSKAAGVEPVATQEAGGGRWHATRNALLSLSIPAIIVGGIAFGIVTPTESAALAIFAAILLGALVFGELKWRSIPGILERTTVNSALVFFLIVSANIFGFVLIYNQIPNQIASSARVLAARARRHRPRRVRGIDYPRADPVADGAKQLRHRPHSFRCRRVFDAHAGSTDATGWRGALCCGCDIACRDHVAEPSSVTVFSHRSARDPRRDIFSSDGSDIVVRRPTACARTPIYTDPIDHYRNS
jgi:tripartite ATP-independent transporter DctM subunit